MPSPDPVVLALSRTGEPIAHRIAAAVGGSVHGREGRVDRAAWFFPNALDHARDLFASGTPVIGVCASGILVRAVAPVLADKRAEPPVIAVSDDGAVVVPLLGGHRGANRLARDIADALAGTAAVTTAGDVALGVALDAPPAGYRLDNPADARAVVAALLAGDPYILTGAFDWMAPLADGPNVSLIAEPDRPEGHLRKAVLAPEAGQGASLTWYRQDHALGVGCATNCRPAELWTLIEDTLAVADVPAGAVASLNTIAQRADEPAVLDAARRLNVPLQLFDADELEAVAEHLATPSETAFAAHGCHGVAEGAALAASGDEGDFVVPRRKSSNATCALARAPMALPRAGRARGRLALVAGGPGPAARRTPEVSKLLAEAEELVGQAPQIDLLGWLAMGKTRHDLAPGALRDGCRLALERAGTGRNVALVCADPAEFHAMEAQIRALREAGAQGPGDAARRVEVICAPGVFCPGVTTPSAG